MKILTIAMLIVFLVSSLVAGISGLAVVGLQVATQRNRQKKQ